MTSQIDPPVVGAPAFADKPFWPACQRNSAPLLAALQARLDRQVRVLEIGAGSGQHGECFTAAQSGWFWQCTDQPAYLPGIRAWQAAAARANFPPPRALDVRRAEDWGPLTDEPWDWVFNANALHIMSWETVRLMFSALPRVLSAHTGLLLYGPFNRGGQFTSPSNAQFDASLRAQDPQMGLRDLEAVAALAIDIGLAAPEIIDMPANNLLLQFTPR